MSSNRSVNFTLRVNKKFYNSRYHFLTILSPQIKQNEWMVCQYWNYFVSNKPKALSVTLMAIWFIQQELINNFHINYTQISHKSRELSPLLDAVVQKADLTKYCSSVGEESVCNSGDPSFIPGLGTSPGEGKRYPLQYSGLESAMDCSPWHHKESDLTERLSLSLSFTLMYYIQAYLNRFE